MNRRLAASERIWPHTPPSTQTAVEFADGATTRVLDWTWRGFEALLESEFGTLNYQEEFNQLERDLTSKHFICIQKIWASETNGMASMSPHHEYPELLSAPPPPGRPPAYDLCFVWRMDMQVVWPIEAKVVRTAREFAPYLSDVQKFICGTAAPITGQGGLIAYLTSGQADEFLSDLPFKLQCTLESVPEFSHRPHRRSRHARTEPHPQITLHHMVMSFALPEISSPQMRQGEFDFGI